MATLEHPAGAIRSYPCGTLTGHAHVTSTPDHLAHTLTASVRQGQLTVSGGLAGAIYRVTCGEHAMTVRAVHVETPAHQQPLMAARHEPAVDYIDVPDDGGVFLEVMRR